MRYLKLHSEYLISKINIIIIILLVISGMISGLLSVNDLKDASNWFNKDDSMTYMLSNNLIFFKLVMINLFSYIWGNSFTDNSDSYHLLIKDYYKTKFKFYFSKIICLILITFFIIYNVLIFTSIFGIFETNWFECNSYFINFYLYLFLISIIYGLLSIIFSRLIRSNYSFFLSPMCFVLGEIITDNNTLYEVNKIYKLAFPSIFENIFSPLPYGVFHIIILVILYFFISFFVYSIRNN